jgi:hypothetical protein
MAQPIPHDYTSPLSSSAEGFQQVFCPHYIDYLFHVVGKKRQRKFSAYFPFPFAKTVDLIQSQFPDNTVSEPMAIGNLRLEGRRYSHTALFWYFTVSDTARNVAGVADEYILDIYIPGYHSIPGGVSNRAALDRVGGELIGYRMAKLSKPLRLFDKLEAARSVGGASFVPSGYPTESVGITPVPLK